MSKSVQTAWWGKGRHIFLLKRMYSLGWPWLTLAAHRHGIAGCLWFRGFDCRITCCSVAQSCSTLCKLKDWSLWITWGRAKSEIWNFLEHCDAPQTAHWSAESWAICVQVGRNKKWYARPHRRMHMSPLLTPLTLRWLVTGTAWSRCFSLGQVFFQIHFFY